MQDIFNKIVTREIPAYIIWESETHLAFLDLKPIQPGHTLVIPKKQIDYIFDMSDAEYTNLWLAAKEVAKLLKSKLEVKRVCVIVEGYAVPHVHIHLIPTNSDQDLKKEDRLRDVSESDLKTVAEKIKN
jgi:histidine triad (HIT) family protein